MGKAVIKLKDNQKLLDFISAFNERVIVFENTEYKIEVDEFELDS